MRVKLLGTAAGGGFPQWNCDCRNCRSARAGETWASSRLQCSVAIGDDDGESWFLIGASPDIRAQVEALPRRSAMRARRRVVEGILLPSADLDQTLGLFMLREGDPLRVFATPGVRRAVCEGLNLEGVLGSYCGVEWVPLPVERAGALQRADGRPSGLTCRAFSVPGKPPRYREAVASPDPLDVVGIRVVDERTGGRLTVAPGLAGLDGALVERLADCDVLLIDGTFWDQHELDQVVRDGRSATASAMGHLPVGGADGSLERLARLTVGRKIYIHVNNTNPMILDDSPERRAVDAAGFEVGRDGQEFCL
jgi:pyrroloquinoline quinone biosynthesis protein B